MELSMFWKQSNKAVYRKSNSIKDTLFHEFMHHLWLRGPQIPNEVTSGRFLLQAGRRDEKANWTRNYLKLLKGLKQIWYFKRFPERDWKFNGTILNNEGLPPPAMHRQPVKPHSSYIPGTDIKLFWVKPGFLPYRRNVPCPWIIGCGQGYSRYSWALRSNSAIAVALCITMVGNEAKIARQRPKKGIMRLYDLPAPCLDMILSYPRQFLKRILAQDDSKLRKSIQGNYQARVFINLR